MKHKAHRSKDPNNMIDQSKKILMNMFPQWEITVTYNKFKLNKDQLRKENGLAVWVRIVNDQQHYVSPHAWMFACMCARTREWRRERVFKMYLSNYSPLTKKICHSQDLFNLETNRQTKKWTCPELKMISWYSIYQCKHRQDAFQG